SSTDRHSPAYSNRPPRPARASRAPRSTRIESCCNSARPSPPSRKIRGRSTNSARRNPNNEIAEIRAGVGRRSRRPSGLLSPPPWLSARAASRSAVVAELHGRLRSGDERAAHRYRRRSRQARIGGRSHRRLFRLATFFTSKSAGTQRMRRGILERFRAAYGERPMALLPAEWIEALLDSKPPHAARSWLMTLRSLCQFAIKRGCLRIDPTANIKQREIKGDGFHTVTEDEIAKFEAHYPIGTKPRLAFALLLYTAQRRSDVVRMGRQHIRDGVLTV